MTGRRDPSPAREAARRAGGGDRAAGEAGPPPPWLEEAEAPQPGGTLVSRGLLWAILLGLLLLAVGVAVGVALAVRRAEAPDIPAPGEQVPLIRSPGPWKTPADGVPGAEGAPVEGQGSVLFEAGSGAAPSAAIDASRLPEEPILPGAESPPASSPGAPLVILPEEPARPARPSAAAEAASSPAAPAARAGGAGGRAAAAASGAGPDLPPASPAPPPPAASPAPASTPPAPAASAAPPGAPATLQLGAFSSAARARAAFRSLADRHAPLAGLEPAISPVTRADGETLYRLRVTLPDRAAADRLCARLRVAGDACAPVADR